MLFPRKTSRTFAALAFSAGVALLHTGCGSDDGAGASLANKLKSLDQLPSTGSLVASSTTSSAGRSLTDFRGAALHSASGTPPVIGALGDGVDQYFFGGLIATVNGAGWSSLGNEEKNTIANQFWGGVDGGAGGQGACYMAQSVGESVGRMLQAGTSACYMKKIPSAAGGVTIAPATAAADVFAQSAADKMVKINVTGEEQPETVFIRVFGTDTVGADTYKVQLYFCGSGGVNGSETIEANKATGVFTATQGHSEGEDNGESVVTAKLTLEGDSIVFDKTAPRSALASYQGEWGTFKGNISIDGSTVTAKRYNSFSQGGQSGIDKNYSISSFSGTSIADLRFLEAAYKGTSTWNGGDGDNTHTYDGSASFQDTYYKNVATEFDAAVTAYAFSGDTFFTSISVPALDTSGLDCAAAADIEIDLDFTNAAVQAIATACEGERFDDYQMCNNESMQTAQNRIHEFYQEGFNP